MTKVVAVVSGGMDSTIMLHDAVIDPAIEVVAALSFDYGQRHKKEISYARYACKELGVEHYIIDLRSLGLAWGSSSSSLISDNPVPEGHYAAENMKSTIVPNRNMIMASIAAGIAVANGSDAIMMGMHAGDHPVYPDCREDFVALLEATIRTATDTRLAVLTPFINMSKDQIAQLGILRGFQFAGSWSCYVGGEYHCGRCGTCVERLEAIHMAAKALGVDVHKVDFTEYLDSDYWKEALA